MSVCLPVFVFVSLSLSFRVVFISTCIAVFPLGRLTKLLNLKCLLYLKFIYLCSLSGPGHGRGYAEFRGGGSVPGCGPQGAPGQEAPPHRLRCLGPLRDNHEIHRGTRS